MYESNHKDFMPKDISEANNEVETTHPVAEALVAPANPETESVDTEKAQETSAETVNPEVGVVEAPFDSRQLKRALWLSGVFSPLIVPTYCIVLALWITPLSHLAERTRFFAAITVLIITALAPTACKAAMTLSLRNRDKDTLPLVVRLMPGICLILCQLLGAYYLYQIYAPEWLFQILVAGAVTTLTFIVSTRFIYASGHTCAMGAMCAVVFFLGRSGVTDVPVTLWIVVLLILSGLVGTAREIIARHKLWQTVVGFVLGAAVTYAIMSIHLFDAKIIKI